MFIIIDLTEKVHLVILETYGLFIILFSRIVGVRKCIWVTHSVWIFGLCRSAPLVHPFWYRSMYSSVDWSIRCRLESERAHCDAQSLPRAQASPHYTAYYFQTRRVKSVKSIHAGYVSFMRGENNAHVPLSKWGLHDQTWNTVSTILFFNDKILSKCGLVDIDNLVIKHWFFCFFTVNGILI